MDQDPLRDLFDHDRRMIIREALEDRRHFRRVHLAVWAVQMTVQLAALAGILTNASSVVALRSSYAGGGAAITSLAFVAFPAICIFVILHYHHSFFYSSYIVARLTETLRAGVAGIAKEDLRDRRSLERGMGVLFGTKYLRTRKPAVLVGWGHPMYVVSIGMVAILNACTFWMIPSP